MEQFILNDNLIDTPPIGDPIDRGRDIYVRSQLNLTDLTVSNPYRNNPDFYPDVIQCDDQFIFVRKWQTHNKIYSNPIQDENTHSIGLIQFMSHSCDDYTDHFSDECDDFDEFDGTLDSEDLEITKVHTQFRNVRVHILHDDDYIHYLRIKYGGGTTRDKQQFIQQITNPIETAPASDGSITHTSTSENTPTSTESQPEVTTNCDINTKHDTAYINAQFATSDEISELKLRQYQAAQQQDYDEAKRCKITIEKLRNRFLVLQTLENQKQTAVRNEDYDTAQAIKIKMQQLQNTSLNPHLHQPQSNECQDNMRQSTKSIRFSAVICLLFAVIIGAVTLTDINYHHKKLDTDRTDVADHTVLTPQVAHNLRRHILVYNHNQYDYTFLSQTSNITSALYTHLQASAPLIDDKQPALMLTHCDQAIKQMAESAIVSPVTEGPQQTFIKPAPIAHDHDTSESINSYKDTNSDTTSLYTGLRELDPDDDNGGSIVQMMTIYDQSLMDIILSSNIIYISEECIFIAACYAIRNLICDEVLEAANAPIVTGTHPSFILPGHIDNNATTNPTTITRTAEGDHMQTISLYTGLRKLDPDDDNGETIMRMMATYDQSLFDIILSSDIIYISEKCAFIAPCYAIHNLICDEVLKAANVSIVTGTQTPFILPGHIDHNNTTNPTTIKRNAECHKNTGSYPILTNNGIADCTRIGTT